MRLRITLPDARVRELDSRVGPRGRSAFISAAVERALEEQRSELIESALGSIPDTGHEWDDDLVEWVREQRHADPSCLG